MQRTIMDFWVGLFVLAGMVSLLILGLKVGNLTSYNTGESYTLLGNLKILVV